MTRYVSCLRLQEIAVLQGPPLLGAALALRALPVHRMGTLALLASANACLMAHVFLVNDWANLSGDLNDVNKSDEVFTAKGVSRDGIARFAASLLAAALLLSAALGPRTLALAVAVAMLSALYSLPRFNWKGRPLLNSGAHLGGGIAHFLMGYSLGPHLDRAGALVAAFIAVTFTAGHLTQEVRDYDGDVRNRIRTNAVALGQHRAFVTSVGLFTLSHALLLSLVYVRLLPRACLWMGGGVMLQWWWSWQAARSGLTFESTSMLQTRYRGLYAVIGILVILAVWFG